MNKPFSYSFRYFVSIGVYKLYNDYERTFLNYTVSVVVVTGETKRNKQIEVNKENEEMCTPGHLV
jgi:hypothetical protein